ncbi:MAG: hypothetical protein KA257_12285 [Opitutaceae bacterium]|nr:hypothetical protein [Opitutaceae bacterium]
MTSRLSRIVELLLLLALGAGVIWAEEKPAPAGESAIAAAKREFDALKASRTTLEQNKLALPKIENPSLAPRYIAPTAISKSTQKEKAAQQKANNWLLEAMQQNDKQARTSDDRHSAKSQDDKEIDPLEAHAAGAADELTRLPQGNRQEETPPKEVRSSDNPLSSFMTGWISVRDQAVLLPKTSDTPQLDAALTQLLSSYAETAAVSSAINPANRPNGPTIATGAGMSGLAPVTDNPYLQLNLSPFLSGPGQGAPATSADLQLPTGPGTPDFKAPRMTAPPAEAKPGPAFDLSKPPQDDKYFPQLKRF